MKYLVVGGGITGISLAHVLSSNGHSVSLVERSNQLGGSWNSNWKHDKYFSENSPRVIVSDGPHIDFFADLGLIESDFANVYGSKWYTNLVMSRFAYKFLALSDYRILFKESLKQFFKIRNCCTLQEWLDASKLTDRAKKMIRIVSILVCDVPHKTNCDDFFGMVASPFPKGVMQMRRPNHWIRLFLTRAATRSNIRIFTDTEVLQLQGNHDETVVTGARCLDTKRNHEFGISADRIVLCCQSSGLYDIINSSFFNNWSVNIREFSEDTQYNAFGLQLHFDKVIPSCDSWCWNCDTDWTVISLPVSDWLDTASLDPSIKTVWSVCVVDCDSVSSHTTKSANDTRDKQEVALEIIRQLRSKKDFPDPIRITFSDGLYHNGVEWNSRNTGFSRGKYDWLPMKGRCENLFALGTFTKPISPQIANAGTAVQSVVSFLNTYEPNCTGFHQHWSTKQSYRKAFSCLFIIIVVSFIVFRMKQLFYNQH
ncbi:NAD(P)-binding Rossmann-like domain-containing protein [Tetraselmis virus 1]|uniref:NAD(P)-binding Rossmann-like domain-containing protein n=1 Tax=Tetraselmis virus 1 TaxID=2060617 RepID=A0A2P0VP60_9VIRU|nr:NAD(P)-binding Rossmann-like domain-containing protein [Tetraselmis virus 1]AUF82695.1 NAD(P)-binding Rossmann-like domain-containing protein [Tetraselmis virus 1]